MDATFSTNDMKFHLFTLMVFNAHCIGMSVAWIITNCQTCNDLVEWLTLLKTKLLRKNLKWKPSCFIVFDVPQGLQALWWVLFSFYLFLSFYVHVIISKFHPTFSIINNVISWNNNKLVFYAWLGLCGVRIKCPFTCTWHVLKAWHLRSMEKNKNQWSAMCNIGWPSHHHVHAHWTRWKHWSLHDSWEKQDHWKLHPTFAWGFMD